MTSEKDRKKKKERGAARSSSSAHEGVDHGYLLPRQLFVSLHHHPGREIKAVQRWICGKVMHLW
jgi:hypothetical protein